MAAAYDTAGFLSALKEIGPFYVQRKFNELDAAIEELSQYCILSTLPAHHSLATTRAKAAIRELREMTNTLFQEGTARRKLQTMLEQLHETSNTDRVVFVFPSDANGEQSASTVACSRTLVRQWSAAFDALLRHGNSFASELPNEISICDCSAAIFRAARDCMCSGKLSAESVEEPAFEHHPLLELADRYDMQVVKDAYLVTLQSKYPLTMTNALAYLKCAKRYNLNQVVEEALAIVATGMRTALFVEMDLEIAGEVLARDDLSLRGGHEHGALELVRTWIRARPDRAESATELLKSVRLDLMGFEELTSLVDGIDSDTEFKHVQVQFLTSVREAIEKKLAPVPETRKRKCTTLTGGAEEAKTAKMCRTFARLFATGRS